MLRRETFETLRCGERQLIRHRSQQRDLRRGGGAGGGTGGGAPSSRPFSLSLGERRVTQELLFCWKAQTTIAPATLESDCSPATINTCVVSQCTRCVFYLRASIETKMHFGQVVSKLQNRLGAPAQKSINSFMPTIKINSVEAWRVDQTLIRGVGTDQWFKIDLSFINSRQLLHKIELEVKLF